MPKFTVGQRWISETEPELGLGIITQVESKQLQITFKGVDTHRTYGVHTAPLKRVIFERGETVSDTEGVTFVVDEVIENDGLVTYRTEDNQLVSEVQLSDNISFGHPEERLFNGIVDPLAMFNLRIKALKLRNWLYQYPWRGMIGGRMALIPHQFYIAQKVVTRPVPRVLLADEVGLGKTIEAGLINHNLLSRNRIERTLIMVPDSLVFQWLLEMKRRFNLNFSVINQEVYLEKGTNPFVDNQLAIVAMGLLKGSEVARDLLAQSDWDMLIVDEAHQIEWSPENESLEYQIVSQLAQRTPGCLLLTATPEQLGPHGHFARLKLLDCDRFNSFEQFQKDSREMTKVAEFGNKIIEGEMPDANELQNLAGLLGEKSSGYLKSNTLNEEQKNHILNDLIDRHGTGRVYFRNTRTVMSKEYDFFPKRILKSYPLNMDSKKKMELYDSQETLGGGFDTKVAWLIEYLMRNSEEKVLFICHSKKKVMAIEKILRESIANIKMGTFHSGLSLMARDRQAAYFADPNGSQILLCTEIGSEGRNFEFASHLILFDLPKKPDLLEQRIGRLDRIGQKRDIHIHVPYVKNSWEEILFAWYHEGLNSFESSLVAGTTIFQECREDLHVLVESEKLDRSTLNHFIEKTQKINGDLLQQIEKGRDRLVELNSFNSEKAKVIIKALREQDDSSVLKDFLEEVFDQFGVDLEDLDSESWYIKPNDNMFIPHFPQLSREGMRFTYVRRKALEREDLEFMSWDHPMVVEILDLISGENIGNVTVATRKNTTKKKSFIEAFFVLEAIGPGYLEVSRHFPPSLIRVLIDKDGVDFDEKWSKDVLDEKLDPADRNLVQEATKLPKNLVKDLLARAEQVAIEKSRPMVEEYKSKMNSFLTEEIDRLIELGDINKAVRQEEIEALKSKRDKLNLQIDLASISLDSFRLIL